MTDQTPSPFDPFKPSDPPAAPVADKPKRKKASGKKKAKAPAPNGDYTIDQAQSTDRPQRKKVKAKRERKMRVPSAIKIEFGTAMALAAEMKPADTELFGQIVVALQKVGKGSRTRIATALAKMFG